MTSKPRYIVVNQAPNYLCSDILLAVAKKRPNVQLELWHGQSQPQILHVPDSVLQRTGPTYRTSNLLTKLLSWLQFTFWVSQRIRQHDSTNAQYLFFSNPPTLVFLRALESLKFDYVAYDLYPDALSRIGFSYLLRLFVATWKRRTLQVFARARTVFVIGEQMALRAVRYLPAADTVNLRVVPLWADHSALPMGGELAADFRKMWGLGSKRIILYAGNLSGSQPTKAFIETARHISASQEWLFVIVGGGSHARFVERRTRSFLNVLFRPPVPREHFGALLSIADWGLVLLSEASGSTSVPSKAYNLLAAGIPLLAMVPEASETARLIDEDRVGLRFSSEDTREVLDILTSMPEDDRNAFSQRALETAKRYTSALAEEFVPPLEEEGSPRGT